MLSCTDFKYLILIKIYIYIYKKSIPYLKLLLVVMTNSQRTNSIRDFERGFMNIDLLQKGK